VSDSSFTPVLKRLWRIYAQQGNKPDAIDALEALFFLNDIEADEKVQLARFYSETWANVERGEKLIAEALRKDPKNKEYLAIKAKLAAGNAGKKKKPQGIQIIRGR
jgi:hypothetical protein